MKAKKNHESFIQPKKFESEMMKSQRTVNRGISKDLGGKISETKPSTAAVFKPISAESSASLKARAAPQAGQPTNTSNPPVQNLTIPVPGQPGNPSVGAPAPTAPAPAPAPAPAQPRIKFSEILEKSRIRNRTTINMQS